jgi:lipoprotein-anchoring transpeptidase ErfK/SrfK
MYPTTRTATPTTATPTTAVSRPVRRLLTAGFIALAIAVSGCASAEAPDDAAEGTRASEEVVSTPPVARTAPAPDPTPPPAEDDAQPATDHLDVAVVARAVTDLDVHDAPGDGAPSRTLPAQTDFGSTTVALVLTIGEGTADGWLEVVLPGRPNGATGWVRADDVELRELDVEVHVDLATRELTVHQDGDVIMTTEVAIGDADHPTPTGRFFITDKLDTEDPDGAYGPYAIGLSGRSEVLTEFAGGDGQIGIHGTNDPASIGEAVSHGCVRVPNAVVRELVTLLPLGTPVVIS